MLDVENKFRMITNVPYMRNQKKPTTAAKMTHSVLLNVLTIATKVRRNPMPTTPCLQHGMKTPCIAFTVHIANAKMHIQLSVFTQNVVMFVSIVIIIVCYLLFDMFTFSYLYSLMNGTSNEP